MSTYYATTIAVDAAELSVILEFWSADEVWITDLSDEDTNDESFFIRIQSDKKETIREIFKFIYAHHGSKVVDFYMNGVAEYADKYTMERAMKEMEHLDATHYCGMKSYLEEFQRDMWDAYVDTFNIDEEVDDDGYDAWLLTDKAIQTMERLVEEITDWVKKNHEEIVQ